MFLYRTYSVQASFLAVCQRCLRPSQVNTGNFISWRHMGRGGPKCKYKCSQITETHGNPKGQSLHEEMSEIFVTGYNHTENKIVTCQQEMRGKWKYTAGTKLRYLGQKGTLFSLIRGKFLYVYKPRSLYQKSKESPEGLTASGMSVADAGNVFTGGAVFKSKSSLTTIMIEIVIKPLQVGSILH